MNLFEERKAEAMLIKQMCPAFDSPDWIYELKLDGFRCLAYLDKKETDLRNKRNVRVLGKFPELRDIKNCVAGRGILDGEVVVMKNGVPDFYELQRRTLLTDPFKIALAAERFPASFVAYDCLFCGEEELLDMPLMQRKEKLAALFLRETPRFAFSRFIEGRGTSLYQLCEEQELEGVVAKHKDSLYHMGKRTKDWVKIKRMADDEFVVAGYIRKGINHYSLILSKYRKGTLVYKGHLSSGVTKEAISCLSPVTDAVLPLFPIAETKGAVWVKPEKVCRVEYMPNTKNSLRQPVFRGYRDDVMPWEAEEIE